MKSKNVFVTVGTTKFDKLIQKVTEPDVLDTLLNLGYGSITLQIGNGSYEPEPTETIELSYYRLKPDIRDDIKRADLVISHCGAGSCMEVLEEEKLLIAVVNENLMDNHQLELAMKLHENGHILYCTCDGINNTLRMDLQCLKPYPRGDTRLFVGFLDKLFGCHD